MISLGQGCFLTKINKYLVLSKKIVKKINKVYLCDIITQLCLHFQKKII